MSKIIFKIKGNASPIGKPKVYFTCHIEDFPYAFEKICTDVFKTHDCAFFYKDNMDEMLDDINWQTDLDSCNLVIIPITYKLLTTENPTMKYEWPYIKEKHIPILPIVIEPGIDYIYSQKDNFGELQYLTSVSNDSTEISYESKLKKYLESVLINDELAQRIRNAFDAYIFLSYRKKDRKYANELMRIFHRNRECRNIAVWFDEFLVPGESFKENIEKILSDSKLFALLVTPSLLEETNGKPNYVMAQEYPAACKNGIDILPIEMQETNKDELKKMFLDLPAVVNANDEDFKHRLVESLSRISQTSSNNPEHNFLLGLAYLEGIDVEINRELALEMITNSANELLPEAIEKLSVMFERGVGVDLNYKKSIYWAEKLVEVNLNAFGEDNVNTLNSLSHLASLHDLDGQFKKSLEIYEKVYKTRVKLFGEKDLETVEAMRVYALECVQLQELKKALELQEKCYELYCELRGAEDFETQMTLCDIGLTKSFLGEHNDALELHKKAYEAACKAYGEGTNRSIIFLYNIATDYYNLKEYDLAIETYTKAHELYSDFLGETNPTTLYVLRSLATAYYGKGDYAKSVCLYESAYNGLKEVIGENHPNTLATLAELPYTYYELGKNDDYIKYAKKVYQAYLGVYGENHAATLEKYNFLGTAYGKTGKYFKALKVLNKAYKKCQNVLGDFAPETILVLENIAAIYTKLGFRITAKILYNTVRKRKLGLY